MIKFNEREVSIMKKIRDTVEFGKSSSKLEDSLLELLNSEQPKEWVLEGESINGTYLYNKVELIENVLQLSFGFYSREIVSNTITIGSKMCVTTTIVNVRINWMYGMTKTLTGIASEAVDSAHALTLATPKTVSSAFKNAVAQLGDFFGRSLNRNIEDEPQTKIIRYEEKETPEKPDLSEEDVMEMIKECKSYEEGLEILEKTGFKYSIKLKNLLKAKK